MAYDSYFKSALTKIHQENRYRTLRILERDASFPLARMTNLSEPVTVWCGVDYLGFSEHPILKQAMSDGIFQYGVGSGGTRTIGGTHALHAQLEKALGAWHRHEAALLFSTGYVANEAALATLGKIIPGLVFISDQDNHMSIIEGIRQAGTSKLIFKHNDLNDLEAKLKSLPLDAPKIIVFESVYSMSGDLAPIAAIITLAEKYQAMTFLDEVHAVGVYGQTGAGLSETLGLANKITIIQGTLSKALGLFGGYIASSAEIVDCIRLHANGFIFTTSLPPALCNAALVALGLLQDPNTVQNNLFKIVDYLKVQFFLRGFPLIPSKSQILPILIGDSKRCETIANALLSDHHIYIQAINYPTVRRGEERLRISPTALHTIEMADQLVNALEDVFKKF